jgi:long-chain fatty acid transport protein
MECFDLLRRSLGLVAPQVTLAAGFQVSEHNARATGRAGAVIATVDDASAVFYNPAGLTGVKGNQVLLGLTLLRPISEYEGSGPPGVGGPAGTYTTTGDFVPVPNIYLGRELSSKAFVGFGFYAPYGLGIEWSNPDTFVGGRSACGRRAGPSPRRCPCCSRAACWPTWCPPSARST